MLIQLGKTWKVLLAVLAVLYLFNNFARELLVVLVQEESKNFNVHMSGIVSALAIAIIGAILWALYGKHRLSQILFKRLFLFILIAVLEAAAAAALAALILKRGFTNWYILVILAMAWGLFLIADVLRSEAKNH